MSDQPMTVRVVGRVGPGGGCIVAEPGDRKTLCGKLSKNVAITGAAHVQAHILGHNPLWCEHCHDLWASALAPPQVAS